MRNKTPNMQSFLLLFLLLHSFLSTASECGFSVVESSVENLLQKYPNIPGVGLQIGYPDEVIYEKYWGQYDEQTVVPLASATKLLSGITIMGLVDDGLIDLDEPIDSYLPQFTDDKALMTVRQMFSHTSGMPNNEQMQNKAILNARNGLNLEQAVDLLACCEPLLYQPGEGFAYGGSSMHIAGRVAEVASGKSWIQVFNQYLTTPLAITSMDYNGLGVTENYRLAGGGQSSLPDYGKVLNMLLNKGRYQSSRILSEQAITTINTDNVLDKEIVFAPPQVDGDVRYGIGTWLRLDEDKAVTGLFSPGAFGFTPWIDYDLNYYAAFMVKDFNSRMAAPIAEIRGQIRQILSDNWCGSKAPEPTSELGLWYDPKFNGHGLEIQKVGSTYSGVFYTFAQSGEPEWYILSVENQDNVLTGNLLRFENLGSSENIQATSQSVGSFTILFNPSSASINCDSSNGLSYAEMTWNINDEQGVWCLQPLLTVDSRSKTNANGWWWNGSQDSGWGFDIYANNTTEFRLIYYYDETGNPVWAFALNDAESENFNVQSPTGFCRSCSQAPLLIKEIGLFNGSINSTSININSESTVSLDIENWRRIDFIPRIFSNPAY